MSWTESISYSGVINTLNANLPTASVDELTINTAIHTPFLSPSQPVKTDSSSSLISGQIILETDTTGILGIDQGGNGNTTPGISSTSTDLTITGSWPNQVLGLTGLVTSVTPGLNINVTGTSTVPIINTIVSPVFTNITGTLQTAAQPNISSVGTLTITGTTQNIMTMNNTTAGGDVFAVGRVAGAAMFSYGWSNGIGCRFYDNKNGSEWLNQGGVAGMVNTKHNTLDDGSANMTIGGNMIVSSLSVSQPVLTNGSKQLISSSINLAGGTSIVSGILPVANGGNGIATPGISGTGDISVSGSWPNQVVAFTPTSGVVTSITGGVNINVTGTVSIPIVNTIASPVFTNITGTLQTASQPNITSHGTLTSLSNSGATTLSALGTGIVHASSLGVLSSSLVSLTSDITGKLGVTNGGTNSSSALSGGYFMVSNSSASMVEAISPYSQNIICSTTGNISMGGNTISLNTAGVGTINLGNSSCPVLMSGMTATSLAAFDSSKQLQSVSIANAVGCSSSFAGSTLTFAMQQDLSTTGSPTFANLNLSANGSLSVPSGTLVVNASSGSELRLGYNQANTQIMIGRLSTATSFAVENSASVLFAVSNLGLLTGKTNTLDMYAGVSGASLFTGPMTISSGGVAVTGASSFSTTLSSGALTSTTGAFTDTTDATSAFTGAIHCSGGIGVAKSVVIGNTATINSIIDSSSTSTGSIITLGGIGVAKALQVGTSITAGGNLACNAIGTTANITAGGALSGASGSVSNNFTASDFLTSGNPATVTQFTSVSTAVTCNAIRGVITTFSCSVGASGFVGIFTLNNNQLSAGRSIQLTCADNGGAGIPYAWVSGSITGASVNIGLYNAYAGGVMTGTKLIYFHVV